MERLINELLHELSASHAVPFHSAPEILAKSLVSIDGIQMAGLKTADQILQFMEYAPDLFTMEFNFLGQEISCARINFGSDIVISMKSFEPKNQKTIELLYKILTAFHSTVRVFKPSHTIRCLYMAIEHRVPDMLNNFLLSLNEAERAESFLRLQKHSKIDLTTRYNNIDFPEMLFLNDFSELSDTVKAKFTDHSFIENSPASIRYTHRMLADIALFKEDLDKAYPERYDNLGLVNVVELPVDAREIVSAWLAPNNLNGYLESGNWTTENWQSVVDEYTENEREENLSYANDELNICLEQYKFIEFILGSHQWHSLRDSSIGKQERLKQGWKMVKKGMDYKAILNQIVA